MSIIPILNKVDLPAADCERVAEQIENVIGIDATNALQISAKNGIGIPSVLEEIVNKLPCPTGDEPVPVPAVVECPDPAAALGLRMA